ncbi:MULTISPECIES: DUF302 domain-containing protein [Micrococcaceae]|jgi:uncharacterized protein (DUF302 family)|uniref:DUF302 domain-containing protein n=1 Tax=Micrococcaceae TaxID=1268 RepID=UPI002AA738D7|nr:DUF302 domain-containing protein [Pseudarthrobacter oxydans]WPU09764.1 DUF302 domain-containing protein [Pseudarthrobacter oxydans]HET7781556.1 DUF302 domain-containing protein [Arthrobacter sp.]
MTYTLSTTIALPWAEALDRTRDALSAQGFGVLTEIDVRSTFEAKLGTEAAEAVGDYVILGACNPALASRALAAEPEMGALLPCNVVVRRSKDAGATTVEAIDPQTMARLSAAPAVKEVADDAGARLRKVLDALSD